MQEQDDDAVDILERLQERTQALVAQRLRSVSIVIGRLHELIAQAHRLGHSHATIHARLHAGGLAASWHNYRVCLVRTRPQAAQATPAAPTAESVGGRRTPRELRERHEADVTPGLRVQSGPEPDPHPAAGAGLMHAPSMHQVLSPERPLHPSSPTHALDALARAQRAAARDYAPAARDARRKARP